MDKILDALLVYMVMVGVVISTIGMALLIYIFYMIFTGSMPVCQ